MSINILAMVKSKPDKNGTIPVEHDVNFFVFWVFNKIVKKNY